MNHKILNCKVGLLSHIIVMMFGICMAMANTSCTNGADFVLPTVTTTDVYSIFETTATTGGTINTLDTLEIITRGVCYSTNPNPSITDNITVNGSGAGEFISLLSGLSPFTLYYVRAYATNSEGTAYGNEVTFTTSAPTLVVEVTNPITNRIWMDRNLGASRVATSSTDNESYGDLYQWGRLADGHQIRTSDPTSILSITTVPGHGEFITTSSSPSDWLINPSPNLWQGAGSEENNNPCPNGYRLPTEEEMEEERLSWVTNDADGAFGSSLKLPLAGSRNLSNGSVDTDGAYGSYWTSTVSGESSRSIYFDISYANMYTYNRALGSSVRCIKD